MTHGVGGFLLILGSGLSCACWAGWRVGCGSGFIFFLLSLQIKMKIKILNSIKQRYPKLL